MYKLTSSFQKLILFLSLICFFLIWIGTFGIAQQDFFTQIFSPQYRMTLLFAAVILLLLVLVTLFRHFDTCSYRRLMCYSGILFLFITIILMIMIRSFRIVPINDSHSIMDQALSMARSGEKPMDTDSIYTNYFSKYSNNYMLALIFMGIFRIVEQTGITDMYLPLILLNMLCILAGILFTWLIAKKAFGLCTAVKVLLLCALNPVYYLMVFWVYTNTLSLPFMMSLIYIGLCLYSAKSFRSRCLLGIAGGILSVIGFKLRPTTVIPVIAFLVCFLFYLIKRRKELRKWLGILAVGTIAAGITYLGVGSICNSYFYPVSDGNYPVTHWLMMGSHNNGCYNVSDDRFTFSFPSSAEKKEATLSSTLEHYQELGINGLAWFIPQKIVTNWSDGYFAMDIRLNQNMCYSRLYSWLVAEKSDLFHLYCQSFWIVAVFLVMIACFHQLRAPSVGTVSFLLILSLFGGILFYCLWEVKAAYAIPFLPLFYLLSAKGGDCLPKVCTKLIPKKYAIPFCRAAGIFMVILCSFLTINLYRELSSYEMTHNDYSILCSSNTWMKDIEIEDGGSLTQEFYPDMEFNSILLRVKAKNEREQNDCLYHVSLTDASGNIVYAADIAAADIRKNTITLSTGLLPASPKGGYCLEMTKEAGSYGDMVFRTRKGICLDTYDGNFFINGQKQGSDLYLQVSHKFTAPYCRPSTAAVLCFGGWLTAVGILVGFLKTHQAKEIADYFTTF